MAKNTVKTAAAKAVKIKDTVEDVVDTARIVIDNAPQVVDTFNRKRSLIERLGVKNPVVTAILAAVATAAGFITGVIPL